MIERYFENGIKIAPVTMSRTDGGEVEYNYGTPYSIRGRIRMLSGREGYDADKRSFPADYRLYCPVSTQVKREDRVEYLEKDYEVVRVNNVMEMGGHLEVDLKLQ